MISLFICFGSLTFLQGAVSINFELFYHQVIARSSPKHILEDVSMVSGNFLCVVSFM